MTKWQKDYLDIPADDYLTSSDYLISMGFPLDYKPKLNDLIGPHEQRYMNLMRIGHKPITILDDLELPWWEKEIAERNYIYRTFQFQSSRSKPPVTKHLVALPGQEWRIDRLIRCYRERETIRRWTGLNQARVGYLLGYTKVCISTFLVRLKFVHAGDMESANASHLIYINRDTNTCINQPS